MARKAKKQINIELNKVRNMLELFLTGKREEIVMGEQNYILKNIYLLLICEFEILTKESISHLH